MLRPRSGLVMTVVDNNMRECQIKYIFRSGLAALFFLLSNASALADDMYYMAPIEDSGVYRIAGFRGTVHEVIFQIGGGSFVTRGEGKNMGTTYANYDIDDLHIGEDGAFEVILSANRPEGYKGDWWKLALYFSAPNRLRLVKRGRWPDGHSAA